MSVKYIQLITKIRLSAHSLVIEKGSMIYLVTYNAKIMYFCKLDFEDEYHFLKNPLCIMSIGNLI